jgi:hypothetical protein
MKRSSCSGCCVIWSLSFATDEVAAGITYISHGEKLSTPHERILPHTIVIQSPLLLLQGMSLWLQAHTSISAVQDPIDQFSCRDRNPLLCPCKHVYASLLLAQRRMQRVVVSFMQYTPWPHL